MTKATTSKTKAKPPVKKGKGKWDINIRVVENGYVVQVSPADGGIPYIQKTFIANSEKELSSILAKYK